MILFFGCASYKNIIAAGRPKTSAKKGIKDVQSYENLITVIGIESIFGLLSWSSRSAGGWDCRVDLNDLLVFTAQWLDDTGCSGLGCADLDGDNNVDAVDFSLLAANWFKQGHPPRNQ